MAKKSEYDQTSVRMLIFLVAVVLIAIVIGTTTFNVEYEKQHTARQKICADGGGRPYLTWNGREACEYKK